MPSSEETKYMAFKPTPNDILRQHWLKNQGFEFDADSPFIVNMYAHIHEAIIGSGIENTCCELSRQVFKACMAQCPEIPRPIRNREMYCRAKISFNIATAALSNTPSRDDAEMIFTAIMWHLASARGLVSVRDTYEKAGRCRGRDVVVLRIKVVPEGCEDRVDWSAPSIGSDGDRKSARKNSAKDLEDWVIV